MQKKRLLPSLVIALFVVSTAPAAFALGWRPAPQTAVLGQALDFTAALRLDPGDTIDAECVTASVDVGDHRLPRPLVELTVDKRSDALVMHVATREPISEPVASVTLAIGCPTRLSRRFVLLADPPGVGLPSVPLVLAEVPTPKPKPAPAPAAAPARIASLPPARAVAPPVAERPRPAPRAPQREPARSVPKPLKAAAEPARARPRLELDPLDRPAQAAGAPGDVLDAAIDAVAQATSAARAAAAAASAAEQRINALERSVAKMQADAAANRELLAELRSRAATGEASRRWLTPLLLAVAALAGLVAWLAWRMRALQQERDRAWRRAAAAVAVAADGAPLAPATMPIPVVRAEWVATPPPAAPAAAALDLPLEPYERTDVLPAPVRLDSGAPRDVSIEELLDLEQQAEFFIVLGQDDAAIDLLLQHLRNTGGGSPLPYLKLLEIYRRRGEREAYERTRERFNERFNAYAPEWDVDLQHGRSLEDYAGVLPRLQQVWPRPLDAMAELEALMFRKSRGELFELPAYREVLFLYSLARDLLDREAAGAGDVDLLLPLADGGEFSSTAPQPHLELERDSVFAPVFNGAVDRPTAPVDLDLSLPDEPAPPRS